MALLHDFEYPAAAAAFRRGEAADPGFAMAYWGEAMTFDQPIWMQQDLKPARAALNKLAPTPAERRAKAKTDREKGYLDAVEILCRDGSKEERDFRYEDAMAKLHASYPDDVDATAFYGLAILGTAHAGRDVATYMRAARIYAKIAPDAGHAQHMTSHIFLALGMWPETVHANVAAIAAVDRARKAEGKGPLHCGHYPSWLGYAYLQLRQLDKAKSALESCRSALESEAEEDPPVHSMDPDESLNGSFANMRLRYLLDTGDWTGEIAGWSLPKTAGPGARLDFAFARAMGEIARGRPAAAHQALVELEAAGREVADIETKRSASDPSYRLRPEIFLLEARALLAEREGDLAGAERLLRQAVGLEEGLPIAFGPPTIDKPTHELLGECLLRHGRKEEAHAEFGKALARTPGRRLAEQEFEATSAGATSRGSR